MIEHDSIKKLDDQDMEKVLGGVSVFSGLGQQLSKTVSSSAEIGSDAESLENRIRRPLKHEVQPKRSQ